MSFYDEVGIRPFINAGGWMYTRYGGTIMPDVVVAAMAEASKHFVNLFELQDQVGRAIAALTHNEAAFVSCGAASGILLCAAAAIAGTDAEKAARLPDSGGLRNQFIMRRCGRDTEADSVIHAAGDASFSLVRQIAAGDPKRFSPPSTNRLRPLSWWNSNRKAKPTPHPSLPVVTSAEFPSSSTAPAPCLPEKTFGITPATSAQTRSSPAAAKRSMARNPPALCLANRG